MNTYTLDEAARVLGTTPDEAKKHMKKENIREFQDPSRKITRYPAQDVDEMARRMGIGSDPQLQLGEGARAKASDSPVPRKKIPDDQVDIGALQPSEKPSSSSSKKRVGGQKSPAPRPGSDSDVRLVADGSDLEFRVAGDSDVKMVDEPKSGKKDGSDSGVRIIPPETKSDSDVKIVPDAGDSGAVPLHVAPAKGPSDSDIRLQQSTPPKSDSDSGDSSIHTEEIDLDAEVRKASESDRGKKRKGKVGSKHQLPTESPYELSESDVDLDREARKRKEDSSDDFVLAPGAGGSSELELGSDELPKIADDEVKLGGSGAHKKTGINLHDPADSGVSLENKGDSSDEGSFELALDSGAQSKSAKPPKSDKGKKKKKKEESSSEFELSLEGQEGAKEPDSDSEFELSLDVEGSGAHGTADSDSEFELTLDDSGGLAPLDEASPKGEKDIFETDFEVPALDDESGQAVARDEGDTDLESSDFDIALEEGDAAVEDAESGSQVVALDDEGEADEGAATVARPRRKGAPALDSEEDVDELLGGEDDEVDESEGMAIGAGAGVGAEPAPWGPIPAIGLGVTAIIMLLVMFISYETIQGMMGYRTGTGVSSTVSRAIGGIFTDLPKE